jgi:hypothetical protein
MSNETAKRSVHSRNQIIKSIFEEYYTEGVNNLDEQEDDRRNNRAVWDMKFLKKVPTGSIYYPTARVYGSALQRAIVDTYNTMTDLTSVTPKRKYGRQGSSVVAEKQNTMFNARAKDWEETGGKAKFLDDAATQSIIEKCVIGKASWITKTEMVEVAVPGQFSIGEDGRPVQDTEEVEVLVENRWHIESLPRDKFVWDANATKWEDVRWGMEIHDKVTKAELYERIKTDGYNEQEVMEALKRWNTADKDRDVDHTDPNDHNMAKFNETIELCHLWGWIQYESDTDDFHKVKFGRITMDSSFQYLFLEKYEDDEDAEEFFYFGIDGMPFIPYVVGYIEPEEGHVEGRSMMGLSRPLQGEENSVRNNLKKNTELSLNTLYVFKRGTGLDTTQIKKRISGGYVWSTADDVSKSVSQLPHQNRSSVGYDSLAMLAIYWQMLFGVTPLSMGISEPSNPEAPFSILQMTNSSNAVIASRIKRFNNTMMEPLCRMVLSMSIQFTTVEEYQEMGVNIKAERQSPEDVILEDLLDDFSLTIDTGVGATNDNAKRQLGMQTNMLLQQRLEFIVSAGYTPTPKDLYGPSAVLRDLLPLFGYKDVDRYTSTFDELMAHTEQVNQAQQQAAEQQELLNQQLAAGALEQAGQAGQVAANEAITQFANAQAQIPGGPQ